MSVLERFIPLVVAFELSTISVMDLTMLRLVDTMGVGTWCESLGMTAAATFDVSLLKTMDVDLSPLVDAAGVVVHESLGMVVAVFGVSLWAARGFDVFAVVKEIGMTAAAFEVSLL